MIKWLYLYLLIIPFVVQVFGQGEIMGIARWQFIHAIFFAGMILIVANCFQKARTKNVFNWDHIWLVGSAVWLFILFHTFFLGDPLTDGIFFFIKFEFWMIFVLLFLTLSETPRQVDLFVWLIILGGCFNALAVIFFYFEGASMGMKSMYTEIQSTAGNADVSGKGTVGIMICYCPKFCETHL